MISEFAVNTFVKSSREDKQLTRDLQTELHEVAARLISAQEVTRGAVSSFEFEIDKMLEMDQIGVSEAAMLKKAVDDTATQLVNKGVFDITEIESTIIDHMEKLTDRKL